MPNDSSTWQVILAALAILATVATYIGGRLRDRRTKTAELVRTYTRDLYTNPKVAELFDAIDHGTFHYSKQLIGSNQESVLIELLDHLNSIGHNVRRKVLSLADIMPTTIAYAVVRTYNDVGVQEYLRQIRCWDEERLIPGYGFRYFEELAIQVLAIRAVHLGKPVRVGEVFSAPQRPSWRVRVAVRVPRAARMLARTSRSRRSDLIPPEGDQTNP